MELITEKQLLENTSEILKNAIINDDFVTVKTDNGNAVIISEAEYKIFIDALKILMNS